MDWVHGISKEAVQWTGHLGVTTLKPPGGQGLYHSVLRFDTPEHMDRWLGSDERQRWVDKLNGIATAQKSPEATGLESWFEVPGRLVTPPPKWKMVVVTFVAVYPLSLLLGEFVSPLIVHWNIFLRALLFPVIAPVALTYVLMPFLTQKVFKRWLYK